MEMLETMNYQQNGKKFDNNDYKDYDNDVLYAVGVCDFLLLCGVSAELQTHGEVATISPYKVIAII